MKKSPERIPNFIRLLQRIWEHHPNQRFGQLLENYIFKTGERGDITSCCLFYQEDSETYEIMLKQFSIDKK